MFSLGDARNECGILSSTGKNGSNAEQFSNEPVDEHIEILPQQAFTMDVNSVASFDSSFQFDYQLPTVSDYQPQMGNLINILRKLTHIPGKKNCYIDDIGVAISICRNFPMEQFNEIS